MRGAYLWPQARSGLRPMKHSSGPAVTAAIIGPRTMDHLESQLTAADITLSDEVLDRIDEIVAPGTTINVADNGWTQQSLDPRHRRR